MRSDREKEHVNIRFIAGLTNRKTLTCKSSPTT